MNKTDAWFIIVTYRSDETILRRLLRLFKGIRVVLIDNTGKNLGYGGGANVGIRRAIERGAEWVVVLNQDIEMTKEAVRELCERLEGLPPGIAGPFVGTLDPKRWTTILKSDGERELKFVTTHNLYVSGACMAIHRGVIKKVGYFYEPYFMYYEDADLSVRAKQHGFPLKHIPIEGIVHKENPVWKKGSRRHEYFLARNHLLFVLRLAPWNVKLYELLRLPKTIWEQRRLLRGVNRKERV